MTLYPKRIDLLQDPIVYFNFDDDDFHYGINDPFVVTVLAEQNAHSRELFREKAVEMAIAGISDDDLKVIVRKPMTDAEFNHRLGGRRWNDPMIDETWEL